MSFWKCNIQREGRLLRLFVGLVLLAAALLLYRQGFVWWVPALALVAGLFVLFEAARGWCLARAFGFKTRY